MVHDWKSCVGLKLHRGFESLSLRHTLVVHAHQEKDMPNRIKIKVGDITLDAELNDTKTAELIWDALPIEGACNTWGDEIYFSIPVETGAENAVEVVEMGDLGYWPPGHAFCIFYGKTPASRGDEIRPASAVNPIGKVLGDATILKAAARSANSVLLERA